MTIEIKLNNNLYRIKPETGCYATYKVGTAGETAKNAGAETESSMGFPMNLGKAVNNIIRQEITESNETVTLQQYAKFVDDLRKDIYEQLKSLEL